MTENNYDLFKYRYILDSDKLIYLEDSNKDKYMNKLLKFRSPLFCQGDKICNKCAGELYYKLGIMNVGLVANNIGSVIMNKALKQFHDLSIKLKEINIDDFIE